MDAEIDESGPDEPRGRGARRLAPGIVVGVLVVAALLALGYRMRAKVVVGELQVDPQVYTVFVLGGSTSEGVPYESVADFGVLLAQEFGGAIGGRPIVVQKLARSGTDLAFALERARAIAGSVVETERCVVLLYSGHNEFLKYDLNNDLSQTQRRSFDTALVEPEMFSQALADYERRLEELAGVLAAEGIPLIVSTLSMNTAEWEPNRSVLAAGESERSMKGFLGRTEQLLRAGRPGKALEAVDAALAIDEGFAWAWKLRGDALRALERVEEAHGAYLRAFDNDGFPTTAPPRLSEIVRRVAQRLELPLADSAAAMRAAAPDALPGFELFWDNVHPRLEGHLVIARAFGQQLEQLVGERMLEQPLELDAREQLLGIDEVFETRVLAARGQYCYGLSVLTAHPEARLERAGWCLDRAEERAPEDAEILLSQGVLNLLKGDYEAARAYWQRASRQDRELARKRARKKQVARLLMRFDRRPDDLLAP